MKKKNENSLIDADKNCCISTGGLLQFLRQEAHKHNSAEMAFAVMQLINHFEQCKRDTIINMRSASDAAKCIKLLRSFILMDSVAKKRFTTLLLRENLLDENF